MGIIEKGNKGKEPGNLLPRLRRCEKVGTYDHARSSFMGTSLPSDSFCAATLGGLFTTAKRDKMTPPWCPAIVLVKGIVVRDNPQNTRFGVFKSEREEREDADRKGFRKRKGSKRKKIRKIFTVG